jgi:uncharacterized protein
MALKEKLRADMAEAMKQSDNETRDVLRMLLAAIKQTEVDQRVTLDDEGVTAVLTRQAKQRRESIADYEKAGRTALAAQEQAELLIIERYLPQLMGREEIEALVSQIIADLGVTDSKGIGQVMGKLMPEVKGRADGRLVNEVVRQLLAN